MTSESQAKHSYLCSFPLHSWPSSWAGKVPCLLCLSQYFLGSYFQLPLDAWWPVTYYVEFSRWRRASVGLLKLNTDAWGYTHQFWGTFSLQNWLWPKVYAHDMNPDGPHLLLISMGFLKPTKGEMGSSGLSHRDGLVSSGERSSSWPTRAGSGHTVCSSLAVVTEFSWEVGHWRAFACIVLTSQLKG